MKKNIAKVTGAGIQFPVMNGAGEEILKTELAA